MVRKIGGFIMALLGVACFGYSLYLLWHEVLLDITGQYTTGVVTEQLTREDEDHNISHYLRYRYEDGSGHAYTFTSDVSESMYRTYASGKPIPVEYSSTFPEISRVRSAGEGLFESGAFAALGALALWFGLWLIWRQVHWDRKLARLKQTGERVIGRLVAVEEDTAETNEDPPKVLVYAFTDKTGQERTGKTFHVKSSDYAYWEGRVGCALDVRVNPADPTDHIALIEESKLLG